MTTKQDALLNSKQEHVGKIESRLSQWGAKLDELIAKATEVGADIKDDTQRHHADLMEKHKVVQVKLAELKAARGEQWESFKAGVDSAGAELENAMARLAD